MLEKSKKVRHTWARTMCHVVRAYIPSLILPSPSQYVIVDSYNNIYTLVKSKTVKIKHTWARMSFGPTFSLSLPIIRPSTHILRLTVPVVRFVVMSKIPKSKQKD